MSDSVSIKTAAEEFFKLKRIAVAGVSSVQKDAANFIYTTLRDKGYDVFPLNPKVNTIEGDKCYPDISSVPGGVDGVIAVTKPDATLQIVKQCYEAGVKHVWMHKSFGDSVSKEAVVFGKEKGMKIIPGGCPMMFIEGADFGHKCIKAVLTIFGRIPSKV